MEIFLNCLAMSRSTCNSQDAALDFASVSLGSLSATVISSWAAGVGRVSHVSATTSGQLVTDSNLPHQIDLDALPLADHCCTTWLVHESYIIRNKPLVCYFLQYLYIYFFYQ